MRPEERAKQAILRSTIPPHFSQWWAITISPEQIEALTQTIQSAIIEAIEEERETCAMVADEMKAELAQRPEKLQYGRTQIEVTEYIANEIRARSS